MLRSSLKPSAVLALVLFGAYANSAVAQDDIELNINRVSPLAIAKQRLEGLKAPEAPATRSEDEREIPKIVGGRPAKKGQFPWQVALILSGAPASNPYLGVFCGGTLVSWRWVLTAAHCTFDGKDPTPVNGIHVYLGSHNFSGGNRIKVKRVVRHNGYVPNSHIQDNDLSLLELAAEPTDKTGLSLVTLIKNGDDAPVQPQMYATVVGWGSTVPGIVPVGLRKNVQVLQYIDELTFHDSNACNSEHLEGRRAWVRKTLQKQGKTATTINAVVNKQYPPGSSIVTPNMVCAGTNIGTQDACFGDSGGPLIVQRGDHTVQVGIVSWGPAEGCGLNALYGVYVRLSRYHDWIHNIIQ